jgi:hypothetical protein
MMFKVTYLNPLDNKRYVLSDDLNESDAKELAARWSDKKQHAYYLPGIKVEPQD